MDEFKVGQVVKIVGASMPGVVGTVIYLDEKRGKYLVRVSGVTQLYFPADELEAYPGEGKK